MTHQLTLGEYIRRRRKELRLSLGDVAEKVDVSYTYMSKLENDRQLPSEATLFKLSQALEIEFAELVQLSDRLPSDIIQKLLEGQTKPPVTAQRKSGAQVGDEGIAKARVDNPPSEIVAALAVLCELNSEADDSYAPDAPKARPKRASTGDSISRPARSRGAYRRDKFHGGTGQAEVK